MQTKIQKCLCVETAGALLRPTWPALTVDFNCECMLTEFSQFSSVQSLSHVRLFATPWTVQSMKFSRPEYWSGSLSLLQGIFPTQGLNPGLLHWRRILYQLSHKGRSPISLKKLLNIGKPCEVHSGRYKLATILIFV